MTETAAGLLAELAATAASSCPTTTRTREQYRRIHLPGPPPRFAICANGGHLLVDGDTDPDWHAEVRRRLADDCAPLAEVRAHLRGPPTRRGCSRSGSPRTSSPTWSSSAA